MSIRSAAIPLLSALAFLVVSGLPVSAEDKVEGEPFPVERTTILRKEGAVYTVEGRITIPKGVEVTCLKDVHIKAQGPGATIVVEGSLKVHGVAAREVIFEGVTIEPAPECEGIRMDQTIFRNGGGVRNPVERPIAAKIFLELMQFQSGTVCDLTLAAGSVDFSSLYSDVPLRVTGVEKEGAPPNTVRLNVRGCTHVTGLGLKAGIVVDNVSEVTVRSSRLAGSLTSISNWRQSLIFDGNKVNSTTLEFRQKEAGRFTRMTMAKCDIYSEKVILFAPPADRFKDTCVMDRCWFKGITDARELVGKVVIDGTDKDDNGTRVAFPKINARPLELAGAVDR